MQLSALCRAGVTVHCERRTRPPARSVLVRRKNGLSHGLNKVKGTSQPGWLPSPRVPLLHRTKDTPVPTATPTLAELATIAQTHRCPVVATHHRRVLLDETATHFRFSAFVSGRRSRQWRPASAPPTTGRSLWPLTVPVRRSPTTRPPIGSSPMSDVSPHWIPHAAHSGSPLGPADARCGHSQTSSGSTAFSPPRSTRRSASHPTGLSCAACIPWPKRSHRRVRNCSLITHGTSRRRGRCFVPVRSRARSPGHRFVQRWPRGSTRGRSLVTALRRCPISTSSWLICTSCSECLGGGECSPDSLGRDQR